MASCLTPVVLKKAKRKVHGFATDVVPCGKCPECRRRRASGWAFRLKEEQKVSTSSAFITLTYDEEHVPYTEFGEMSLCKDDVQKFIKRLRKYVKKYEEFQKENKPLKYYLCGEYGTATNRPHYHIIMFNLPKSLIDRPGLIAGVWGLGRNVRIDPCNIKTINYTVKYMMKQSNTAVDKQPEFSLMSKGMGKNYLTDQRVDHLKTSLLPYLVKEGGERQSIPRYYRDKVFNEDELRQLHKKSLQYIEQQDVFSESHRMQWVRQKFLRQEKKDREKRLGI